MVLSKKRNRILLLNTVALSLHLVLFIIIGFITWQKEGLPIWTLKRDRVGKQKVGERYQEPGLSADNCPMDTGNIMTWGNHSLRIFSFPESTNVRIALHVVILTFFFLSFFFQVLVEVCPLGEKNIYTKMFPVTEPTEKQDIVAKSLGVNWIRYLEYSISAYCVLLSVALLAGITDICLLVCFSVLCHVCMILGLCAEWCLRCYWYTHVKGPKNDILSNVLKRCALTLHVTGWICIATPLVIIVSYYRQWWNNGCDPNSVQTKPPSVVIWVVIGEVILFICFGFVQIFQFMFPDERLKTESTYIILSVVSKGLLGILVSANLFV